MTKRFSSLRFRLAATFFLIGSIIAGGATVVGTSHTKSTLRKWESALQQARVQSVGDAAKQALTTGDHERLHDVLMQVKLSEPPVDIAILGLDYRVVAACRTEFVGTNFFDPQSDLTNPSVTYTPVEEAGVTFGWIRAELITSPADAAAAGLVRFGFVLAIMCIGVLLLASLVFSWLLTRRLRIIAMTVGKVDSLGVPMEVEVSGSDEIADLASTLNQRTEALRNQLRERHQAEQMRDLLVDVAVDWMVEIHLDGEHLLDRPVKRVLVDEGEGLIERPTGTLEKRIGQKHFEEFANAVRVHVASQSPYFEIEMVVDLAIGPNRRVLIRGKAIDEDENGIPARIIAAVIDSTDQHRASQRLVHADKMSSLGRLSAGLAHDFNNLLTVTSGHAELLLQDNRSGQDTAALEEIVAASDRGRRIVDELLRLGNPKTDVKDPTDVHAALGKLCGTIDHLLGPLIGLELRFGATDFIVPISQSSLERLILNFASNTSDATTGPGMFCISTENLILTEPPPEHPFLSPGRYLEILICDTGSGIPPHLLDRVFDPFVTSKPVGEGTGLGLANAWTAVVSAGGVIQAGNREDASGAQFCILLPLVADRRVDQPNLPPDGDVPALTEPTDEPKIEQAEDSVEAEAEAPTRILVVEDHTDVLTVVDRALTKCGYVVVPTTSASEAVDKFSAEPVDLVLTDLLMPDATGEDLAIRLRAIDPSVRIIFMTGFANDPSFVERIGPEHVLAKPFTIADLQDTVAAALADVMA